MLNYRHQFADSAEVEGLVGTDSKSEPGTEPVIRYIRQELHPSTVQPRDVAHYHKRRARITRNPYGAVSHKVFLRR